MPCRACDSQISAIAEICPHCGVRQFTPTAGAGERSAVTAGLLCLFLGVFGAHRLYAGKTGTAILQFLTLGGFGLWWLYDLILIATGQFRDREGHRLGQGL